MPWTSVTGSIKQKCRICLEKLLSEMNIVRVCSSAEFLCCRRSHHEPQHFTARLQHFRSGDLSVRCFTERAVGLAAAFLMACRVKCLLFTSRDNSKNTKKKTFFRDTSSEQHDWIIYLLFHWKTNACTHAVIFLHWWYLAIISCFDSLIFSPLGSGWCCCLCVWKWGVGVGQACFLYIFFSKVCSKKYSFGSCNSWQHSGLILWRKRKPCYHLKGNLHLFPPPLLLQAGRQYCCSWFQNLITNLLRETLGLVFVVVTAVVPPFNFPTS